MVSTRGHPGSALLIAAKLEEAPAVRQRLAVEISAADQHASHACCFLSSYANFMVSLSQRSVAPPTSSQRLAHRWPGAGRAAWG